jgi:hypothetical protein
MAAPVAREALAQRRKRMARKEERLFDPAKIDWMLDGGLEKMDAGELQLLLVMAETKLQDGYKPNAREKRVVEQLRTLAGEDARDIRRNVRKMVKGSTKTDSGSFSLPPVFDRLRKRLRKDSD